MIIGGNLTFAKFSDIKRNHFLPLRWRFIYSLYFSINWQIFSCNILVATLTSFTCTRTLKDAYFDGMLWRTRRTSVMNVPEAKSFRFPRSVYVISLVNPFDKQLSIHEYLEREHNALLWELPSYIIIYWVIAHSYLWVRLVGSVRVSFTRHFFGVVIGGYFERRWIYLIGDCYRWYFSFQLEP